MELELQFLVFQCCHCPDSATGYTVALMGLLFWLLNGGALAGYVELLCLGSFLPNDLTHHIRSNSHG